MNFRFFFMALALSGLFVLAPSCGSDDGSETDECLASDMFVQETQVLGATGVDNVVLTFDVTNNSSSDYNIATISDASHVIHATVVVTTTDGIEYESSSQFPGSVSAGATTSASIVANFGAGKEYQSYTISIGCN